MQPLNDLIKTPIPNMNSISQIHVRLSTYSKPSTTTKDEVEMADLKRIKFIAREVCREFMVDEESIYQLRTRKLIYVLCRKLIIYFSRRHAKSIRLKRLSSILWHGHGEKPHHSTLIHATQSCQDMIDCRCGAFEFYERYNRLNILFDSEF